MGCIEDEYREDKGQLEVGGVMTPQNVTTIFFIVTTASVQMSMDNPDDESILTRATVDTPKP